MHTYIHIHTYIYIYICGPPGAPAPRCPRPSCGRRPRPLGPRPRALIFCIFLYNQTPEHSSFCININSE